MEFSDGTKLQLKGRQPVAEDKLLRLSLSGGGYGDPMARDRDAVRRDLAGEYISKEQARDNMD